MKLTFSAIFNKYRGVVIVGLIVVLGTTFLIQGHAATATIAIEAETGARSAAATVVSDGTASNAQAIKFGSATGNFAHPGILVNRAQLDFTKAKITAGEQPWTNLFNTMKADSLASLNYTPSPAATIDCTVSYTVCDALDVSAKAAYTDALLWYFTGNVAYAQKSIEILNAWSAVLRTTNGSQAYLVSAWAADAYPRAAEIIRYTYTPSGNEAALNVPAFNALLTNVFLPLLGAGSAEMKSSNGNWDLSMTEGMMNIAVFQDNHTIFDTALARWRARAPAYFYLTTDNNSNGVPLAPPGGLYNSDTKVKCFWLASGTPSTSCNTSNFFVANGQNQETCRDYGHVGLGTASLFNAAETAYLQGTNLYGEQQTRLVTGLEYNAGIMNTRLYPANICIGAVAALKAIITEPTYSIGYNHYANRLHLSLPNTLQTVQRTQVGNTYVKTSPMMVWEALTHTNAP